MPELNAETVTFKVYEKLKKRGFKITPQGRSALLSDAISFFSKNVQELRRLHNDQALEKEIDDYVKYALHSSIKLRGRPVLDDKVVKELRASCGSHRYGC